MFFIVILLVWTAMHAYVFWRMASVPWIAQHIPRTILFSLAGFLWVSYIAARFLESAQLEILGRALEFLGAFWVGALFLAFICFLIVDIVTGFGLLLPRIAPALRTVALATAAVLFVIALVQGLRAPVVHSYEVSLPGLPPEQDGTVVVVMSDTHLGNMTGQRWLEARLAQIDALKPDLLIMAGDIVEGDTPREAKMLPVLRRFHAPLGVWAVTGNHEFYAGLDHSLRLFESAGWKPLRDRWFEVRPGLVIAGVDDLTARRRYRPDVGIFVDKALAGRPANTATIFVSHSPLEAARASQNGVGLMISGHTHNGQLWPFTYVVQQVYPLIAGQYDLGSATAIVCRGTGTWGPRMRLWGRGEIVRVVLRAPAKIQAADGRG